MYYYLTKSQRYFTKKFVYALNQLKNLIKKLPTNKCAII